VDNSIDNPEAISELLDYQDGSVVSRTLVKDKAGTVTVFAFDAGESLSEHTAPYDTLLMVAEGAARVTIATDVHNVTTGQILRLPAKVPHAVHAVERFKMLLVMIRVTGK